MAPCMGARARGNHWRGKGRMTYRRAVMAVILLVVGAAGMVARPVNAGPIVRTQTLDQSPMGVAVDTRTRRAFITTSDANDNGSVSVLDTGTGALVNTVAVGPGLLPLSVSVDERAGRAFVINQNSNTLSVLDARSGALLRTVAVGQSPAFLLVDKRAGRALVVNQSGNTVTVLDALRGRAFVTSPTDDSVTVLDARSMAWCRTIALDSHAPGAAPWLSDALAVDEQAGRVFVAEDNGSAAHVSVLDARGSIVLHA